MKKGVKVFAIVLSLLVYSMNAGAAGYKPGDVANDFKLENVDGQYISLGTYTEAKGFIVVFTCNHCPFSKAYEERIIELHKKYADLGYPVIAINPNDPVKSPEDSFDKMKELANEKAYPFPYLFDAKQAVAAAFGATRTPHVFVLTNDGKQRTVRYIGAIDDNSDDSSSVKERYVENAVNGLISEGKVKVQETKAIGCTIKWK